ncbi:MDR family MFS transporter [Lactococcus termiticola]|uniref:Major facilitator superfamily transporter n=1 Tax=Lactococcus termiticola TaxID=2169526 RepID=A0A2R5HJP5_9LACT|nr:MDR family MFS transporter [Lactococcus termiticola]GBG96868.1 major facilitator superfamily transporter [Lactococcus termiticola]
MNKEKLPKELMQAAWLIVLAAIPSMLDSTMVNIAVNRLQSDLHASLNMVQWGITGYVLAIAIAVPVAGYFIGHFNGKHVLNVALAAFAIFSVLSGLANSIDLFILFRIFQGLAGGFITLLNVTLIMSITPRNLLGRLMSVISVPIILAPILGPVIGGALVEYSNWRFIFFINLPICLISIFLNHWKLQDFLPTAKGSKLDFIGIILLSGLSASLIYGLVQGSENPSHFFNAQMLSFVALGIVLGLIYALYNRLRHGQVVLPLRFFKDRNYSAANIGIFFAGIAANGPLLLLPLYFQNSRGFSVIEAALIMIPQGLGMMVSRPRVGRLIDAIGAKSVVLVSSAICLLATLPFVFAGSHTSLIWLAIVLFVRGLGFSGLQMPMMTDIFVGLDRSDIPAASVGQRIIQNVGSSFGSAIVAVVITSVMLSQHTVNPLQGYQTAFLVSALMLIVIAIVAFFMSSKRLPKTA